MNQAENFKSKYPPHLHLDARDLPESCWKHSQKKNQTCPLNRSSKSPESTNYYSTSTSYKPQRNHVCTNPMYSMYTSLHAPDASHVQSRSKPTRDKHYSNFSSKRKTHFDNELGDIEKLKFIDEQLENFVQDNVEGGVEEDVAENDHEQANEFLDKDYEEQEADDEIDDESDASPQAHRAQRAGKNETMMRQQRWRTIEQQMDTRRVRCPQRMVLVQNHPTSPRYYHNVAEHDVPEPLSEEDFVRTSLRSPTRRQSADYRQWSSRNEPDRYDDVTPAIQTRRPRTKPDVDRLIESEFTRLRRCNRCGNLSSKKNEPTPKNGCRFDDCANIPTKGPIGDEPENREQAFCVRCSLRCNAKDTSAAIMDNSPSLYAAKSRRQVKSPTMYEVPEQGQEKLSTDYSRSSSRYQRKSADVFTEKPKHSLHTSHGTSRIPTRYVE